MVKALLMLLVVFLPSVTQASVFGIIFDTDYHIAKSQMKHEKDMAKRQMKHHEKMAKINASHAKDMAKRGVTVKTVTIKPTTVKVYYRQQGSVRYYYVK